MVHTFKTARIGCSDREVLRLGFGSMGLGGHFGQQDELSMEDVILEALERGVNFIDTARAYGASEKILGRALQRWKGPRPFLATKALPAAAPAGSPPGAGWQHPVSLATTYPRGAIRRSLEQSLEALGVDCVDLLQLHQYWPHWPDDEWREEVDALRQEGLISLVGVSVPDHRHDFAIHLVRSGMIDSVQTIINIFDPLALDSLVPLCQDAGVMVIARCILDEGGLTGAINSTTQFAREAWLYNYFDCLPREIYLERVERLRQFTPAFADSLAELAIRYVLSFPGVSVALCSMHVRDHLIANLQALERGRLPADVLSELRHRHRWIRNFYQARRYV